MISESVYKEYELVITKENFLENYDILVQIIKNSLEYKRLSDRTQIIFDNNLFSNNIFSKVHNRQTHTMVVQKVSGGLAKKVGLDEFEQKMAELIGLCHDLGHTAFGHNGESRIDEILKYHGISAEEFDKAYREKYDKNSANDFYGVFSETSHSFEHHAHSVRILRKILEDNSVYIQDEILDDLDMGILCHSESRTKKIKLKKPLYAIPRMADKSYAFTDIYDIVCSENDIPRNIFEKITKDKETIKYLEEHGITLNSQDSDTISAILDSFNDSPQEVLESFLMEYVEKAKLEYRDESYSITSEGDILRQMRLLQAIVKFYLRVERIALKEDKLANAMVDEVIAYKIEDLVKNKKYEQKQAVIEASIFVSELTDTELRNYYRVVCANEKWVSDFEAKMADETYKGFETKISVEERAMIRKNPDIMLNYYFDREIKEIKDEKIKLKITRELVRYKTNPSLELRRELIEMVETAKNGGDPFFRKRGSIKIEK